MSEKKRVLFLSHSAEWGGAEKCLYLLVKHLPQDRFAPLVLLPREGDLVDAFRDLGVSTQTAPIAWWTGCNADDAVGFDTFAEGLEGRIEFLKDLIHREGIDLVFTNTITVIDGALAAAETGVPHVWHLLEMLSRDPALTPILPLEYVYSLVDELSDELVVVADCVRQEVHQFYSAANVHVLTTGVDPLPVRTSDKTAVFGVPADTKVVTFVGALSERKGVSTLAQCASIVCAKHPNVQFFFVGPDQGKKKEIRRIAKRDGVRQAVHCTGPRKDIGDVLAASDVLVMPSLSDPLPLTVMEAMAAEVSVVATRSGGCEEMVVDGVTGYLVLPNGVEEMAQAISRVLDDPAKAQRMGQAGRQRQEESYSVQGYAHEFEQVFNRCIELGGQNKSVLRSYRREISTLKSVAGIQASSARQRQDLAAVNNSLSYRLGRYLTWPVRSALGRVA